MSRTRNRRQVNSEPLVRRKKQPTRKIKSLSNRHKKNFKISKESVNKIKKLTEEILFLLDDNKTETQNRIKSIITKNFDINKIEKTLSDLKDDIIDEIQDIRGKEGNPDGRDFVYRFNPSVF
jgi:hypothetical protein